MRRPLLALALVVAGACGGDDDAATPSTTSTTQTSLAPDGDVVALDDIRFTLTEVASLSQPLALVARDATPGFYVAEKGGRVQYVPAPNADPQLVLDIADDVSRGGEQGLLGLEFSPAGDRMYVSYTNVEGDTRIDEYAIGSGPTSVDVSSRNQIFATDQPYSNHNGGHIVFGPDGLLWFGLGDGGAGGDPEQRAQNPGTVLGKLLRFEPGDMTPEIYALGLRNPWRFSFDRGTDDLWIGDVGQGKWEEIDHLPAGTPPGTNFGWDLLEGSHPFEADEAPGTVLPVYEYDHGEGQSVAGGFVYRGSAIPGLRGVYVFADTYAGELRLLRLGPDGVEHRATGIAVDGRLVSSFAEDADGELYVMSLQGGVYRLDPA